MPYSLSPRSMTMMAAPAGSCRMPHPERVGASDVGLRFLLQGECLRGLDGGHARRCAVKQPVQDVEDMDLGRHAAVERQFDRAENGLLVMVQNERQDLHHLPITPGMFEQVSLQ